MAALCVFLDQWLLPRLQHLYRAYVIDPLHVYTHQGPRFRVSPEALL